MDIKAIHPTALKSEVKSSADLERVFASAVTDHGVRSMAGRYMIFPKGLVLPAVEIEPGRSHSRLEINIKALRKKKSPSITERALLILERARWFVYTPHTAKLGTPGGNKPEEDSPVTASLQTAQECAKEEEKPNPLDYNFKLPGFSSTFNMSKLIMPGENTVWAEALHFNPSTKSFRMPEDRQVVNGIVGITEKIKDIVRPAIARAYGVKLKDVSISYNSFYRDPVTNRQVGGARYSRHMWGDAADFRVFVKGKAIHPYKVYDILNSGWSSGLASSSIFTHIDNRSGYARWSYGY